MITGTRFPYTRIAKRIRKRSRRIIVPFRLLIHRYAPKDKVIPILSGEWGYSTAWKDFDEERQAKYLEREFLTNISNDILLSIWYDWHDDGDDPKEPEHHFGIVHREYHAGRETVYDPKPAYEAAKKLMSELAGMQFNKAVPSSLTFGDVRTRLLFTRGAEIRIAEWNAWSAPEKRESDAPTCIVRRQPKQKHATSLWSLDGRPTPLEYFVKVPSTLAVKSKLQNKGNGVLDTDISIDYEAEDYGESGSVESKSGEKSGAPHEFHVNPEPQIEKLKTIEIVRQWEKQGEQYH